MTTLVLPAAAARGAVGALLGALLALTATLAAPAPLAAQNAVGCDFDIPDDRGLGVVGKIMYLVGRPGASSSRGSFYITNGNTPAGDDDGDGYAPACDFNNLFVSLRGNLVNHANQSLAIPGANIVVSNLGARLPSGEAQQVDVQVEIPNGTVAGRYRGFVTIRDNVILAAQNAAGEILNLDNIWVEVEVLPERGFSVVHPDQPIPLDSVVIAGRAGRRAEGVFRIANAGNTALENVRISATDLRSESAVGLIIPAANITFSTASFASLAVGDTQRVTVVVQVPRGILFENNPVRTVNGDIARVAFNGDPGTPYRMAIFDMMGLLVYTTEGTVFAGLGGSGGTPGSGADFAVSLSWPLANGRGEAVASGVYLVVVESIVNGQRQLARDKLIVIR